MYNSIALCRIKLLICVSASQSRQLTLLLFDQFLIQLWKWKEVFSSNVFVWIADKIRKEKESSFKLGVQTNASKTSWKLFCLWNKSLMSSPKKKSIREARLERIEKLLEEHEKSMFSTSIPSSHLVLLLNCLIHHGVVNRSVYVPHQFTCCCALCCET